jgi:hypothetical protein
MRLFNGAIILSGISFMPTLWEHGPYRFFVYSADREEPPHVHVERERNKAKFWLDPVRLQNSGGYSRNEINRIQRLIEENQKMLLEKWYDYFSD